MITLKVLGNKIKYYMLKMDGNNFFHFRLNERYNSDNGNKELIIDMTFRKEDLEFMGITDYGDHLNIRFRK